MNQANADTSIDKAGPPLESPGPSNDMLYEIPPERMAEALAGLEVMMGFLEEIEQLGIGSTPPVMVFDPSWDEK